MSLQLYVDSIYKYLKLLDKHKNTGTNVIKPLISRIHKSLKKLFMLKMKNCELITIKDTMTIGNVIKFKEINNKLKLQSGGDKDKDKKIIDALPEKDKEIFLGISDTISDILSKIKAVKSINLKYKDLVNTSINDLTDKIPKLQNIKDKVNNLSNLL